MPVAKSWLMVADGEPLSKVKLSELAEQRAVMALDGAFREELLSVLEPQVVLGDFDSLDPHLHEAYAKRTNCRFVEAPDQSKTDLEKGLQYLLTLSPKEVVIANATGWRLDHCLLNLRLLKKFHGLFESLWMISPLEKIYFIKDQTISLKAEKQEALSLLAFPKAVVRSRGLLYELQDYVLDFGVQESTSNALAAPPSSRGENNGESDGGVKSHGISAEVEVKGEALLLVSHDTGVYV